MFTALLLLQQPGQLSHGFLLSVVPQHLIAPSHLSQCFRTWNHVKGKAGPLESLGSSLFIAWLLRGSHVGPSPWLNTACSTSRVPTLQHCDVGPPQSLQPIPTHDTELSSSCLPCPAIKLWESKAWVLLVLLFCFPDLAATRKCSMVIKHRQTDNYANPYANPKCSFTLKHGWQFCPLLDHVNFRGQVQVLLVLRSWVSNTAWLTVHCCMCALKQAAGEKWSHQLASVKWSMKRTVKEKNQLLSSIFQVRGSVNLLCKGLDKTLLTKPSGSQSVQAVWPCADTGREEKALGKSWETVHPTVSTEQRGQEGSPMRTHFKVWTRVGPEDSLSVSKWLCRWLYVTNTSTDCHICELRKRKWIQHSLDSCPQPLLTSSSFSFRLSQGRVY